MRPGAEFLFRINEHYCGTEQPIVVDGQESLSPGLLGCRYQTQGHELEIVKMHDFRVIVFQYSSERVPRQRIVLE